MSTTRLYKIAASLKLSCASLDVSPARVLERAGLASDCLEVEGKGVDIAAFYGIWSALAAECTDPEVALRLGQGSACGPFQPALLAFSASPDAATGLRRLALFKPLIAPVRLDITERENALDIVFHAVDGYPVPEVMAAVEIIFFLDLCRTFTAYKIMPQSVVLPGLNYVTPAYREFVGVEIEMGNQTKISFHTEDARRPLISADTEFYHLVEKELLQRLAALNQEAGLPSRVSRVIAELMPSGQVSSEMVSARLNMSKRSLQRKLKDEGSSFREVLDETRASLAMTYLRDQKLSVEETSFLLAYQDPNSFYRAFHDWTGMTPAQARAAHLS